MVPLRTVTLKSLVMEPCEVSARSCAFTEAGSRTVIEELEVLARSSLPARASLGVRREKAFKFSFLLSVPAVLGALGLTLYEQHEVLTLVGVSWTEILVGIAVSIVVSYFALKLLWKALAGKKFYLFAFYCWLIGAVLLALNLGNF